MGTFFVKSFQSYLFNVILQWRIQKYNNAIIPGDLVQHENEVIVSSTPDSIENVVLPLLGQFLEEKFYSRTTVELPENEVGDYYDMWLERLLGKQMKDLRNEENPVDMKRYNHVQFILYGSYRRIVAKPKELTCCVKEEGVQLGFMLPRGVYATTMLREMSGGNSPVCLRNRLITLSVTFSMSQEEDPVTLMFWKVQEEVKELEKE